MHRFEDNRYHPCQQPFRFQVGLPIPPKATIAMGLGESRNGMQPLESRGKSRFSRMLMPLVGQFLVSAGESKATETVSSWRSESGKTILPACFLQSSWMGPARILGMAIPSITKVDRKIGRMEIC